MQHSTRIIRVKLPIIVFTAGAIVMILELVGSRLFAPYLGTSLYVWTSLIGVILGSLSLGYALGGRLADKHPSYQRFSYILLLSGILIFLLLLTARLILLLIASAGLDLRIASVLAGIIIFTPASTLLGMVSPYAVRLQLETVASSGKTVGNLYAISTIGSIVGTFLTGFVLLNYVSISRILLSLAIVLILLALIAHPPFFRRKSFLIFFISLLIVFGSLRPIERLLATPNMLSFETPYKHVTVMNSIHTATNRPVRLMITDTKGAQSGMFLDDPYELVFEYTKWYDLAFHFFPHPNRVLMIGGAGYSYPKHLLQSTTSTLIDVVEIDPGMTDIARDYFALPNDPRLTIYHEDARPYLRHASHRYDIIFSDAFQTHYAIPPQLTTKEAAQEMYNRLTDDGLVAVNIISGIEGDVGKFLRAEFHTFQTVFPQVYIFPVNEPEDGNTLQNILLIALKSSQPPTWQHDTAPISEYLGHRWTKEIPDDLPLLTDELAPVDAYVLPNLLKQ